MSQLFAQVILPLSLHDAYTYKVPAYLADSVVPGKRVIVQFGPRKFYAALVSEVSDTKPEVITDIKEISDVLDDHPIVLPKNFELWRWMAEYYCCTLGDVFRAALPTGLKLESKTRVIPTGSEKQHELSKNETLMLRQIGDKNLVLADLESKLGSAFSYATLKSLIGKKLVYVEEKLREKYRPKTATFVKWHPSITSEKGVSRVLDGLGRAKKQLTLLQYFIELMEGFDVDSNNEISKHELLKGAGISASVFKGLCQKNILLEYQKQVSRLDESDIEQVSINLLNENQTKALEQIKETFLSKQVSLIHGITASGKTEIYIHLIDQAIRAGKQALYLVPEIALTTQIIQRLKNVFGHKVGIYHSRLNSQERVEVWEKTLEFSLDPDKGYQVILAARSGIFLPFSRLGIVIVDEEHENSFKQFDPAPRYNARDMAVILGYQHQAKVLLGSATPSYESYHNAISGKYGLVKLNRRHAEVEMPELIVADLKRAYKRKEMHSVLSPQLFELIESALEEKEQVILFQNRRGYSPYVECFSCGTIPKCKKCDVSLTYHKYKKRLSCHYCGYSIPLPERCDECGSSEIKTRGFGTEKIEDDLKHLFRNARIARMDLDSTQSKNAFEKIVSDLENRKTDILIGTQMVAKGLDFDHVSVVGILNADNLINFPDFRAHERAYQLISQVAGRSGRKYGQGKVILQTTQPDHPLIEIIRRQDFAAMLKQQFEERQLFRYPPFYKLIKIVVKHKNQETVNRVSRQLADSLKQYKELIILGPEFPLVSRIKLWHHKEIWIKIDRKLPLADMKKRIVEHVAVVKSAPTNSSCQVHIDVDPF